MTTAVTFASRRGMVGADFDSLYGHWSTSGFTYWALARSLWQPTAFNRTVALGHWAEQAFGGQAGDPSSAAAAAADYVNFWERWTTGTFTNATVRAMQNAGPGKLGRRPGLRKSCFMFAPAFP